MSGDEAERLVPAVVARCAGLLPKWPPSVALAAMLTLALGESIRSRRLEALRGKRLTLHVVDAGVKMRVLFTGRRFEPVFGGQPEDVAIRANAWDFLQLARRRADPDSLFFNRRLIMEGDTELGLLVKNALDAVDFSTLLPVRPVPFRAHR